LLGDNIQAAIHAINQIDIGVTGRPVHRRIAPGWTTTGVTRPVTFAAIGFHFDDAAGQPLSVKLAHQAFAQQVTGNPVGIAGIKSTR